MIIIIIKTLQLPCENLFKLLIYYTNAFKYEAQIIVAWWTTNENIVSAVWECSVTVPSSGSALELATSQSDSSLHLCQVLRLIQCKTFTLRAYFCNLTTVTNERKRRWCVTRSFTSATAVKDRLLKILKPGGFKVVVGFSLCISSTGKWSYFKCSVSVMWMTNLLGKKKKSGRLTASVCYKIWAHITWKIHLHCFERNALSRYGPTSMVKNMSGKKCSKNSLRLIFNRRSGTESAQRLHDDYTCVLWGLSIYIRRFYIKKQTNIVTIIYSLFSTGDRTFEICGKCHILTAI